jgi:hypothetical protein
MELRDRGPPGLFFSERMLRLLDNVQYDCARTPAVRETAQPLRYNAAKRHASIGPSAVDPIEDGSRAEKAWVTMTRIDGGLAATVRFDVAEDEYDNLPALDVFSNVIVPHLRAGSVVLEFSEAAVGVDLSKNIPELPFAAMRAVVLGAEYFQADFVIAAIGARHQAFYRRVFGFTPWCEPRHSPNSDCAITCIGLDFRAKRGLLEAQYPFLRSTRAERNALFNRAERRILKSASLHDLGDTRRFTVPH